MERVLLIVMALGYLFLQVVWFVMDSRSIKKKVKFHFLLQGNTMSRIIALELTLFIILKYFYPDWDLFFQSDFKFPNYLFMFAGFLLYSFGLILCVWARWTMKDSWTPAEETHIHHKKKLLTTGPFSFTRNPIYLGLILIYLGFFTAMKSYFIITVIFIAFFFYKKALNEEKILEKDFGEQYLKYKSRVNRFLWSNVN